MTGAIDNLIKTRIEKLEKLRKLGVNCYPAKTSRNTLIGKALTLIGKRVIIGGRVRAKRGHGKISFWDVEDESGKIQVCFRQDKLAADFSLLALLDIGDFIEVTGAVFKTKAGEVTVLADSLVVLTKSIRPLPEKWHGIRDIELKLRKRYLDLIMDKDVRKMFRKKAKFWRAVREYLIKEGFLEVETPVLEAVPGGADAEPFTTHHNALDTDFYLRISLELHLKRLIVGGFEKIFEIGRVFRNEGMDIEHLQDYTQMEFYWAYADYNDLMDFLEPMYKYVVKKTTGGLVGENKGVKIDWGKKWERVDYIDLLKKELGFDYHEVDTRFLYDFADKKGVKVADNLKKGRLIDYIYKKLVRPKLIGPMFLIHLPTELSPLSKRLEKDPKITERLLVVANGAELGNGFSELNDPTDQKERFKKQQKLRDEGDKEAHMYDADFVEALEYGMPPTAGFGMSERLFGFLMDKPIRETIFFPPMKRKK